MIRALALTLTLFLPAGLAAAQDCARLAADAGAESGLPDGLLPAISLVESGRGDGNGGLAPWPWTLNQGGKGMYFDTREEALAYLNDAVAQGVTNIDVGCMQLNWKWHSAGFASAEDMIDPVQNTRYAARFLSELQSRLGAWETAAAAYHSTDPARGEAYLQKVLAAQGSFDLSPMGETIMASAASPQLQGILAFAGAPLVALATAPPADGFQGETPFDNLPVEGTSADQPPSDTAATGPDAAPPQRPRRDAPPDLPMVIAAAASRLTLPENLPPRLRRRWSEVEEMRQVLAEMP